MPPRGDPTVTDGHTVPPRDFLVPPLDFLVPPRDFLVWKNFPPFLQRDKTLQRTKPCPVFPDSSGSAPNRDGHIPWGEAGLGAAPAHGVSGAGRCVLLRDTGIILGIIYGKRESQECSASGG